MSRLESRIEYNFVDGVEPLYEYTPGGYHPIVTGDVLHDRYRIVNKLGFGGYSTVWLARDTRLELCRRQNRHCSARIKYRAARNQGSQGTFCRRTAASGRDSILPVLDEFTVNGPNGVHTCYATEPTRCILHDASFSQLLTLEVVRALVGGLTQAVAHIYIHKAVFMEVCPSLHCTP